MRQIWRLLNFTQNNSFVCAMFTRSNKDIWNNYFWGNGEYQTHDHITYIGRSKETACGVTNAILGFYIHRTIYSGWKTALKSQSISERARYTFTIILLVEGGHLKTIIIIITLQR